MRYGLHLDAPAHRFVELGAHRTRAGRLRELTGEADGPEAQRVQVLGPAAVAERDLGASAADVDDHGASLAEVHAAEDAEKDETRLFAARDHVYVEARFVAQPAHERRLIGGFPCGGGRDREHRLGAVRSRQVGEAAAHV